MADQAVPIIRKRKTKKNSSPGFSDEVQNALLMMGQWAEKQIKSERTERPQPSRIPEERTEPRQPKENKKPKKDKKTLGEHFDGLRKTIVNVGRKNGDVTRNAILGPMSLLVSPIEDFFGGSLFENLFSGKGKSHKKNPNENDLAKQGDIGALYIGALLREGFNAKKKEGDKGLLDDLLSKGGLAGLAPKIASAFGKLGGPAMIAGSLLWAVADGFAGLKKAKNWGVSDPAAFIGSFLGGTESGWKGAFSNMGKWALAGLGVGMAFGPVGMLIGGLVGAAIGGIFGFIGGENIAKGLDELGKWFNENFNIDVIIADSPLGPFMKWIENLKADWSDSKTSIGEKIGKTVGDTFKFFTNLMLQPFIWVADLFTGKLFKKSIDWGQLAKSFGSFVIDLFIGLAKAFDINKILRGIGDISTAIGQFIMGVLSSVGSALTSAGGAVLKFGAEFFKGLFSSIGAGVAEFMNKNPIGKFLNEWIVQPITNFFKGIGNFFNMLGMIWNSSGSLADKIVDLVDFVTGNKSERVTGYKKEMAKQEFLKNIYTAGSVENQFAQANLQASLKNNPAYNAIMGSNLSTDREKQLLVKKAVGENDVATLANLGILNPKDLATKYAMNVQDAIIKPDGTVIRTHPEDTIIATKNTPELNAGDVAGSSNIGDKLDKMIALLSQILQKDIQINLPPQSMSDMEMIMNGGIV